MERQSNVDKVEIVKVIKVESICGKGVEGDPIRKIWEYYSLKGALIVRIGENNG